MPYPLRIEDQNTCLLTSRTANSRLWFVNDVELEEVILGYIAKYQERYEVVIYSLALMGNHYHLTASYPLRNKAKFFRDLNSAIARAVKARVKLLEGNKLWGRRYSGQVLPNDEDIGWWSFYVILNPVSSGLVMKISEYGGYTSFADSLVGESKKYKVVDWTGYYKAKRYNKQVSVADFITKHSIKYTRLPGYEGLSKEEYRKAMQRKLEERRLLMIKERTEQGKGFAGRAALKQVKQGALPRSTKTSTRSSYRPLVLTLDFKTKQEYLSEYFEVWYEYKEASRMYLSGDSGAFFPLWTYKPPLHLSG